MAIQTPNGAGLDPGRRPDVDSLEPLRDDVDVNNTRDRLAENQAGDPPTQSVNNEGRRNRMTNRSILRDSNTPEVDAEFAGIDEEVTRQRRNASLTNEGVARLDRRVNILESTISSTEELKAYLNHNDLEYEDWLERRALGDEVIDRNDQGFMGRLRATSRNFLRFLDGEFDVQRGQTDLDRDLFRRNYSNEIKRRGLKAVFNRRNAVGAALMFGTGLMTGGIAPVVWAGMAGMVGGRLASEGISVAQGNESRARQRLMKSEYEEFDSERRIAHSATNEHLPLDQRERWAKELTEAFYSSSEKITSARNDVAQIRDRQDIRSNWFASLGSVGAMAGGAGLSYLHGGAESLFQFMGKINLDTNFVHHQLTTQGGDGVQFIYNAGDNARMLIQNGSIKEWYDFGGALGHSLATSDFGIGAGIGAKIAELGLAGALGTYLGGFKQSEKSRNTEMLAEVNTRNEDKKSESLSKFNKEIALSHEQETISYVEATAEQLNKRVPQEGELWYISDPDYTFELTDDLNQYYREGDGAVFVVMHVHPNNTAELVQYSPDTRQVFAEHRMTVPLIDMVEHMNPDAVRNHEVDDARNNLEAWLRSMELDGHLVKQADQPEETKRSYTSQLPGAIIEFSIGDDESLQTINGRTLVLSGKYRLTRLDLEPFSPYARVSLVDLDHDYPSDVQPTLVISSNDLMRFGRRAYLPGQAPAEPKVTTDTNPDPKKTDPDNKPQEKTKEIVISPDDAKKLAETKLLNETIDVQLTKGKDKNGKDRPNFGKYTFKDGDNTYSYRVWSDRGDQQALEAILANTDTAQTKVKVTEITQDKQNNIVLKVKLVPDIPEVTISPAPVKPLEPAPEPDATPTVDEDIDDATAISPENNPDLINSERNIESKVNLTEIYKKAGNRTAEEVTKLVNKAGQEFYVESRSGEGKLRATLAELKGEETFQDRGVVYLKGDCEAIFIGDTHGDPDAVRSILEQSQFADKIQRGEPIKLVFLGDYVDRGKGEIVNIEQILDLKLHHPDNVVLLRGNHETNTSGNASLEGSLIAKFGNEEGVRIHTLYQKLFNYMPLAVATENGIVAVHGGISDHQNLLDLNRSDETSILNLLWSDPGSMPGLNDNHRGGVAKEFGRDVFDNFMLNSGAKVMIRGHQHPPGKQWDDKLITVFSTGEGSEDGHYNTQVTKPIYVDIDLRQPIESIKDEYIIPVKYEDLRLKANSALLSKVLNEYGLSDI